MVRKILLIYIDNVLKSLEEYRDTTVPKITGRKGEQEELLKNADDNLKFEIDDGMQVEGAFYEEIVKKQRKFRLFGHTDAVFSVSISPDKKYIISGSFDETIRLWSVFTKTTLVIYKGHFSPVLCVKFSPFTHYFVSGGCDRTARLWTMNSPGPLRMFVGHLSDVELVDFHPNSFYLVTASNDKTIRLYINVSKI
jgi:WD40 repeat protein